MTRYKPTSPLLDFRPPLLLTGRRDFVDVPVCRPGSEVVPRARGVPGVGTGTLEDSYPVKVDGVPLALPRVGGVGSGRVGILGEGRESPTGALGQCLLGFFTSGDSPPATIHTASTTKIVRIQGGNRGVLKPLRISEVFTDL